MREWLTEVCGGNFMPHGQCYLWTPTLIWLHALSDGLIALAYFSILLVFVVRKRRDVPFSSILLMFGALLVACGATHLLEVWTVWNSQYYLTGAVKAGTAAISLAAAVALFRVMPAAVQLAGPEELRRLNESLEARVQERTVDLESANTRLRAEAEQRLRAEGEIKRLNHLLQLRVDELESLLKMLPVGVGISRDAACRDVRANDELARMLEIPSTENASMSAENPSLAGRIRILAEGRELSVEELPMQRAVTENRSVASQALTIRHADGRTLELLCGAEPLRDAAGRPSGCVAAFQDVTELKSALDASARHAAIVACSEDAVVGSTLDGIVTDWNQAAERMFGYRAEEMIGRALSRIIPPGRENEEESRLADVTTGASARPYETQRLRKDGGLVDVSVMISPIRDARGRLAGFSKVARDITERRRAEQQRRELDRKLQETQKLESLGVLAGGIAHDFNNLLTSILGNAALAAMTLPPTSSVLPFLHDIEKSAGRAAELCAQMLAYASRSRFVARPLDMNRVIEDTRQLLATSIGRTVTLRLVPTAHLPPVMGDAAQLRQVMGNLVINAAEAIGARPGVVTVSTAVVNVDAELLARIQHPMEMREGRHVVIEVADTGSGMAEAILERIFEPFFTTKFTGRGLGLAAVLGIMRAHNGGVSVSTKPGNGSTFRLFLPAAEVVAAG